MFRRIRRMALALSGAGFLAVGLIAAETTPVAAYGPANWQVTFAGTGTFPSTGVGFGFWGWCEFAGGVTSGNSGDCQVAQYFHAPSGSGFTCQESLNITAWDTSVRTFHISGTATVNPTRLTAPCVQLFPGATTFSGVDTQIPASAGHYNFGGIGGTVVELQITVTQIP